MYTKKVATEWVREGHKEWQHTHVPFPDHQGEVLFHKEMQTAVLERVSLLSIRKLDWYPLGECPDERARFHLPGYREFKE